MTRADEDEKTNIIPVFTFNRPDICRKLLLIIREPLKTVLIICHFRKSNYAGTFHKKIAKCENPYHETIMVIPKHRSASI